MNTSIRMSTSARGHALSDAAVREYHDRGLSRPMRLWGPEETPTMRALLERHYYPEGGGRRPASKTSFATAPDLIELLQRPQLTDPIASILGEDLFLWRAKAFTKAPRDPGAKEIPWHQDRYCWPLEPMIACSAWIAVDDTTIENGCMYVIPGSHRSVVPHIPATEEQLFVEQADPAHFDAAEAEPLTLRAGEFVLFNERLLHRSGINHSARRRFGLAVRVLPALTRVLEFDAEDHALVLLRGADSLGFNRLAPVGAPVAA